MYYDSYFWIRESKNKDHFKQPFIELIVISQVTNSEVRITVSLPNWQADRLPGFHFENPLFFNWLFWVTRLNHILPMNHHSLGALNLKLMLTFPCISVIFMTTSGSYSLSGASKYVILRIDLDGITYCT